MSYQIMPTDFYIEGIRTQAKQRMQEIVHKKVLEILKPEITAMVTAVLSELKLDVMAYHSPMEMQDVTIWRLILTNENSKEVKL
jgi:hypothetical protein